MPKKAEKNVSFDSMVKQFMRTYDIPTQKDIDKLNLRLDHLEQLILKSIVNKKGKGFERVSKRRKGGMTASDTVLNIIKSAKQGIKFAEIQARTGFEEKKLRNIIFRLKDLGKIRAKSRGLYIDGEASTEPLGAETEA